MLCAHQHHICDIAADVCCNLPLHSQADGIMLATPTGSTAYSVAAGGSMVHPNVQAILLTPICPHSLNFRPIILPDYVEMELRVPDSARVGAWVCFDGKQRQELQRGDSVFIKMSENPVPTINRADLTTGVWVFCLHCALVLGDCTAILHDTGAGMQGFRGGESAGAC
jgi:NAD kinase